MTEPKPRVLYLDIDHTLLRYDTAAAPVGSLILRPADVAAAPGAGAFLRWANDHFEVRWLTGRSFSGRIHGDGARMLATQLGVEPALIESIRGLAWDGNDKTKAIDFTDPRPWVWVEDDLRPHEKEELARRGCLAHWHPCDVTKNPERIIEVGRALAHAYGISSTGDPFDLLTKRRARRT